MNKLTILLFLIGVFLAVGVLANLVYSVNQFEKQLSTVVTSSVFAILVFSLLAVRFPQMRHVLTILLGISIGSLIFASSRSKQEWSEEVDKIIFISAYCLAFVTLTITVYTIFKSSEAFASDSETVSKPIAILSNASNASKASKEPLASAPLNMQFVYLEIPTVPIFDLHITSQELYRTAREAVGKFLGRDVQDIHLSIKTRFGDGYETIPENLSSIRAGSVIWANVLRHKVTFPGFPNTPPRLFLLDDPEPTCDDILSSSRKWFEEHNPDVVIKHFDVYDTRSEKLVDCKDEEENYRTQLTAEVIVENSKKQIDFENTFKPDHPTKELNILEMFGKWPEMKQETRDRVVMPFLHHLTEQGGYTARGKFVQLLELSGQEKVMQVIADCTIDLVDEVVINHLKGKLDRSMWSPIVGACLYIALSLFAGMDWLNFEKTVIHTINEWFNQGVISFNQFVEMQAEILRMVGWKPCAHLEGVSNEFPLEYRQKFEKEIESIGVGVGEEPFEEYNYHFGSRRPRERMDISALEFDDFVTFVRNFK